MTLLRNEKTFGIKGLFEVVIIEKSNNLKSLDRAIGKLRKNKKLYNQVVVILAGIGMCTSNAYAGNPSVAISQISGKLNPIFNTIVSTAAGLSWKALITMLIFAGIIQLTGNEFGAKKIAKNAFYGWAIIQIANLLN